MNLQAVILAGGFGTRLSPLTDTRPKPLVKILGKTVLEACIEKLTGCGIRNITVSVMYKHEMIEKVCRKYPFVTCKRELTALGTAGGVKNCYDGKSTDVLVVSGDAVFDFDAEAFIRCHTQNKNTVTILGSRKKDPTSYGVMLTEKDGNIYDFCEKPSWKNVRSNLVNTGIYMLSNYAVDSIPENVRYDFSKELFPKLLKEGRKIGTYESGGYWCDIGSFDEYLECNRFYAKNIKNYDEVYAHNPENLQSIGIHAEKGVYVSKNTVLGNGISITDASAVCEECEIGDGCDIKGSVISKGCMAGKGTSITNSIIGEGVKIGENCIIPENCVIGDGCIIADGTVLKKKSRIKPFEITQREDGENLFLGKAPVFIDEDKMLIATKNAPEELISLAEMLKLALSKDTRRRQTIGVMSDKEAQLYKQLFVNASSFCGIEIFDFGTGCEAMIPYAEKLAMCDLFLYFDKAQSGIVITLRDEKGRELSGDFERKLCRLYENCERQLLCGENESTPTYVPAQKLYRVYLEKCVISMLGGRDFSDMTVYLKCTDKTLCGEMFKSVFEGLSGKITLGNTGGYVLSFDDDGVNFSIGDCSLDINHIRALVVSNLEILGIDGINIPKNVPEIFTKIASGRKNKSSNGFSDTLFDDDILASLMLLCLFRLRTETLPEMLSEIPEFAIFTDEYILGDDRGKIMESLSRMYAHSTQHESDGIRLELPKGCVTVIPGRVEGFKIISEAASMEAAKELSVKIGKAIKNG